MKWKYIWFFIIGLATFMSAVGLSLVLNITNEVSKEGDSKKYLLPKLPYAYDALEPYIDKETMRIHHDMHHQAYVNALNDTLKDYPELQGKPLEELLSNLDAVPKEIRTNVRNFGGGHLNHSMFWLMMSPNSSKVPKGEIKKAIDKSYASFDNFKEQFSTTAKKLFGSGWAWLCVDKNKNLLIVPSKDQDSPLSNGLIPILTLDVWEHAYYLKYQNRRPDYITNWWHVINWDYVEKNYLNAIK